MSQRLAVLGVGITLVAFGPCWLGCGLDRSGLLPAQGGTGGLTSSGGGPTTTGGHAPGGGGSGGVAGMGGRGGAGGAGGSAGGGTPVCGNGIIEAGEQCDDGNQNNGDSCPDAVAYGGTCQDATCGDGHLWNTDGGTETCDDGDLDNSDSCPDDTANGGTCRDAMCGDGHVWSTDGGDETCEDGDLDNSDSCPDDGPNGGTCKAAICGDGLIWDSDGGNEQCDDSGTDGGDGCSDVCQVECAGGYAHPTTHHCYRYFTADRTWLEAQGDCRSLGAGWDLASITSTGERDYVDDVIDIGGDTWIGGNDIAVEGTFEWSNGEPWSNPIWDSGEPNGGTNENCVEMEEHTFGSNDSFNDSSCAGAQDYLCEMTPAGS
ncbi:MAG: DUF4215 domain-containing protein [Deltaproteobacteria bacterium]|jgi:cysteine-rich repeat protein|nr:DUF4215 domain-containing protein [Deltaproteobacteria bacterium]MBW2529888.1 DUF4215 domain-containing protein [Deltaproteobacteria bacterium]